MWGTPTPEKLPKDYYFHLVFFYSGLVSIKVLNIEKYDCWSNPTHCLCSYFSLHLIHCLVSLFAYMSWNNAIVVSIDAKDEAIVSLYSVTSKQDVCFTNAFMYIELLSKFIMN